MRASCILVLVALEVAACSDDEGRGGPADAAPDAAVDAAADAGTDSGPPLDCESDRAAFWTFDLPEECAGRRTCIDQRRRFWVDGEPFFPRGVYNGGFEYERVLDSCPAGAECEATTPADVDEYVQMLVDGGINLIMERSRFVPILRDAVNANPDMRFAHLLWSDPFTVEGHDALVDEIEEAAADPDVVMWFGPDEVDLWDNWSMAAGIRRILFGSSPEIDALLAGEYDPGGDPYLPEDEPAHDPHALPFGAALAWDWGLAQGTNVYDVLLPITYPYGSGTDSANEGQWGTWRISAAEGEGVPVVPVLQMIGIPVMGLSHPTPGQVEALVASAMVHGARGAFYYNLIGDQPSFAGRDGWFAPDDSEAWAVYARMHALQDRLAPVLHSSADEDAGESGAVEWRRWRLGRRSVVLVVNPTATAAEADLGEVFSLGDGDVTRSWLDCEPMDPGVREIPGYSSLVAEVVETAE